MTTILDLVPFASLRQGDLWKWTVLGLSSTYPSNAYTLKYTIIQQGQNPISWTSTALSGGFDHQIWVPSSTTNTITKGTYQVQVQAVNISTQDKTTLATGSLTVLPDLSTLTSDDDPRSQNQRIYDAICAVIEGRASDGQQELTCDTVTLKNMTIEELFKMKAHYKNQIKKEQGLPLGRIIPITVCR